MYSRQIQPTDPSPYLAGSKNDQNWSSVANAPTPDPKDSHLCKPLSNSPCVWSKTHPSEDICCMCGKSFPGCW